MRIFVAIIHHWNPDGSGEHASLRPDYQPRLYALQDQLLCLRRMANHQGVLNHHAKTVDAANQALRHTFTIKVITDGQHHVFPYMDQSYREMIGEEVTHPLEPKQLGFEAHRVLANNLDGNYDLYVYLEDDLLIHDPLFFHKVKWFQSNASENCVLMPHRYETYWQPVDNADKFYIDGPIADHEIKILIPEPPDPIATSLPGGNVTFVSPSNPHSGCFVLTHSQLKYWSEQPWFLDRDSSLISPLESAATLGILKTFKIFKPHFAFASFLELQHWGTSFRSLIGGPVSQPASDVIAPRDSG